ncbi:TdeIII family type II restriction endonuclease [candidate division KSB1 bacterium]|nr:TdeIII family type II restriction endonuclease [candidate division KSB1 bacterium]
MIDTNKKEKISIEVIKILCQCIENLSEISIEDLQSPFQKAFYNNFLTTSSYSYSEIIKIKHNFLNLNGMKGQSFFENVAHILSDGEKREYTAKKLGNLQIHKTQKEKINSLITKLSNSESTPDLGSENSEIFIEDSSQLLNAIDFSADVFIEESDSITSIELKSVKPNSGEMRGEKQKILEGKAALHKKFPQKEIHFFIGFPFDPTQDITNPIGSDKSRFMASCINMNKFFSVSEVKLADELWNFLSDDENTMQQLLDIINSISTTEFLDKFQYVMSNQNRTESKYPEILKEWHLTSEVELINHTKTIKSKTENDKRLTRIYNQSPFKKDGNYNKDRYNTLIQLIQ